MWVNRIRQGTLSIKLPASPALNQFKFDDEYFLIDVEGKEPQYVWLHVFAPYTTMVYAPFRTNTDWNVQLTQVSDYVPVLSHLEISSPNTTSYGSVSSAFTQETTLPFFYALSQEESPTLDAHVTYTFRNIVDITSLYRVLFSNRLEKIRFISDTVDSQPSVEDVLVLVGRYPEHEVQVSLVYSVLENNFPKHIFNTLLNYSKSKLLLFSNEFNIVDPQSVVKYKGRYLKNMPLEALATSVGSTFLPNHILCRI